MVRHYCNFKTTHKNVHLVDFFVHLCKYRIINSFINIILETLKNVSALYFFIHITLYY